MPMEIHNSKYMTTREVITVLDEVSIASSGPTQYTDSAAAVITAGTLLSAPVSFLSSRRNLVRDRGLNYYSLFVRLVVREIILPRGVSTVAVTCCARLASHYLRLLIFLSHCSPHPICLLLPCGKLLMTAIYHRFFGLLQLLTIFVFYVQCIFDTNHVIFA